MQRFIIYKYAYLYTIPLFILALIWNPLAYVYAAVYFIGSLALIFEITQLQTFINSSAATHYETASRWNSFNYIIAGYLAFSGIMFMILSFVIGQAFTIFLLWTVLIVTFQYFIPKYIPKLHRNILVDYISEQVPSLDKGMITAIIDVHIKNPEISSIQLANQWKLQQELVESILYYYDTYIRRNKQVFAFVPAFMNIAKNRVSEQVAKQQKTAQPQAVPQPNAVPSPGQPQPAPQPTPPAQ